MSTVVTRCAALVGAAAVILGAVIVGVLSAPPALAVANGQAAPEGFYPFSVKFTMTDIHRPDGTTYASACSGALIAPQWVITAGHCFHDVNRVPVSGPTPYDTTATLGATDLSDTHARVAKVVEVRQAGVSDVALAKLDAPITDIQPLLIAEQAPVLDEHVVLAGWGATSSVNPTPSTHLNLGVLKVSDVAGTTAAVVGVAPAADTSACLYDSGAPYFVPSGTTTGTLVSVESNGPDCPHSSPETTARVDVLDKWITDQTTGEQSVPAFGR